MLGLLLTLASLAAPGVARAQTAAAAAPLDSLAAFPSPRMRAWQAGFVRPDRMEHFGLSFVLTSALIVATRDRRVATGATLSLLVGKELWDRKSGGAFDPVDLAAGAGGVGLAVVCVRARGD